MTKIHTQVFRRISGRMQKGYLVRAAEAIRNGELIAFPTETVYGLGENAYDERAIQKIFRVKGRPVDNPLIVHVASMEQAEHLFQIVPKHFYPIAKAFWPGPLSIIGYKNASVLDIVTAGLPKVAVRMPDHRIAQQLIWQAAVPLVAPSANISGSPSPTNAADVLKDLDGKIFGVIDGGACNIGIESTVIDLSDNRAIILRPGKITKEEIEEVIHRHVSIAKQSRAHPASPGMKYTHYAPKAKLFLFTGSDRMMLQNMKQYMDRLHRKNKRIGLLASKKMKLSGMDSFFSLKEGTAFDYARMMYNGLRVLDSLHVDCIFCPAIAAEGVGLAVMNRLKKAATRSIKN